ncbi:hypothetical protein [Streptomyces sp. NPDC048155]|uniref:hypothetical protein n=1 Tax=unclassified Streptomyces TaxID=2593676 RepID=UPI0033CA1999
MVSNDLPSAGLHSCGRLGQFEDVAGGEGFECLAVVELDVEAVHGHGLGLGLRVGHGRRGGGLGGAEDLPGHRQRSVPHRGQLLGGEVRTLVAHGVEDGSLGLHQVGEGEADSGVHHGDVRGALGARGGCAGG